MLLWDTSPLFSQSAGFPNKVTIPCRSDLSLRLLTSHVVSNESFINTYCWRLTIGVPKCICWNRIPSIVVLRSGAFRKLLNYEGRALINEISVPIKETLESSHVLPLHEDTVRRWLSVNQRVCSHKTVNLPSPWSLGFPDSRTVGNKFVVF